MKTIGILTALVLCGLAASASAQEDAVGDPNSELRPNRVRYEIVPPDDPAHAYLLALLQRTKALERLSQFLSPLRLPRDLVLNVQSCDGDANAYYSNAIVTVCYEYLQFIRDYAPVGRSEEGVRRFDALIGPTIDVILHEVGHAVFDLLDIPVLGREEDAADMFAAYMQLNAGREEARALILGAAYLGLIEAREGVANSADFSSHARVHGTAGQRYFNMLCLAYGFDTELFADVLTIWHLPEERASGCVEEYRKFDGAFKTLIEPFIDPEQLVRSREERWLLVEPPRKMRRDGGG